MQVNKDTNGFSVTESPEDIEKQARKQRMADRETKDKTKVTNQEIWDLLMDIQAQIKELNAL